jgi:hypothetical protein
MTQTQRHWIIFIIAVLIGTILGDLVANKILEAMGTEPTGTPHFIAQTVSVLAIGMGTYAIIDRVWQREKS